MNPILKKNIIDKILTKIPNYLNPVDFLHEALDISKESVYRRLKGDIAFTLEDLIRLSPKLSLSLDEIVFMNEEESESETKPILFQFRSNRLTNPSRNFLDTLSAYIEGKERVKNAKETEVLVATNRMMILSAIHYRHILRFYYYRWIHLTQRMPLNYSLSDVVMPDNIGDLREKITTYKPIGRHTYILDNNFLKNTLHEVRYYYDRKLISEEDINSLQQDFFSFVDTLEYMVKRPLNIPAYTNNIYISATRIDSTGMYCRTDNNETLDLWLSFGSTIHTHNNEICKAYMSWVNSLKKYSSLISRCDEALQTAFIDRQRFYVEALRDKNYNYEQ